MRNTRTWACLVVVFALSLVATATASATSFNFKAAKYPVKELGNATNDQGFEIPGAVTVCTTATFNTEQEGAPNPEKNEQTIEVHPTYTGCRASLSVNSNATVKTEGCNYIFHAVKPGENIGKTDVKCAAGKEIKVEVEKLAGCTISVGNNEELGNIEYLNNTPAAGEEEVKANVSKIKSKATSQCGLAGTEFEGVYREGEIVGVGEAAVAKMAAGPSKAVSKGVVPPPEPETATAVELVPGGPHWYSNHSALPAESGGPGKEGKDIISWGKLTLEASPVTLGLLTCFNEFAGDLYNPEGAGATATAGEGKVDAFNVYDCTNTRCETTLKSKIQIIPEGLSAVVEEPKLGEKVTKFGEWETSLFEVSGKNRLKTGNKTSGSKTQIQFLIDCPPVGAGEINIPSRGELTPKLVNGTVIGSGPGKIEFGAGTGELELAGIKEGKVKESLKSMGYEGGEIITASNP